MIRVTSIDNLVATVRKKGAKFVGIEGFSGSGKTYLGRKLVEDFGGSLLSTDCYVRTKGGEISYPDRLDLVSLKGDIVGLARAGQFVTLEGICLRDIASRISTDVEVFVYVKVLSAAGLCHGELNLENFESNDVPTSCFGEPDLSDYRYHSRCRPHEKADIVFERYEDSVGA